jgi:hypothetical protein
MTDTQLFQILSFLLQLATMIIAYLARRQSKDNSADIKEVKKQTNHLTEQLVTQTGEASEAKGRLAGEAKGELAGNIAGRAELIAEQAADEKRESIFQIPKKK